MPLIRKLIPEGRLRDRLERWHGCWKYGFRPDLVRLDWPDEGSGRPRILLLADRPGWAMDTDAQGIARHISTRYDTKIAYAAYRPDLNGLAFDLIFVLGMDEFYHTRFVRDPRRVIKQFPHLPDDVERQYGVKTIREVMELLASDASTILVTSARLQKQIAPWKASFLAHQGIEREVMRHTRQRAGDLRLGWAGNIRARHKGVKDILLPAADGFDLRTASGRLSVPELVDFYNSVDVICVASTAEGGPLPLLEGMACGCFPVATDVGIVPEVVTNGDNGLIVERRVDAFRKAFRWCAEHLRLVREAGRRNSETIARTRSWEATIPTWERVFDHALSLLRRTENKRET